MNNKYTESLLAKHLIAFALLLTLAACSDNGINVTTTFENTQDVKEGTVVYFEDQAVGEVSDISNRGNGSLVEFSIDEDAAENISSNAAIVVNRLKEGAPLEIYNSGDATNEPLAAGQELKGLDSMFQLGAWMVGDAVQIGSGTVSQYVDAFQKYLKGDQFQADKAQVQQQVSEATTAAKEALETAGQDVVEAVDEVKSEMAQAVEDLGDEIKPMVKEFAVAENEMAKTVEELGSELKPMVEGLVGANGEMAKAVEELGSEIKPMVEELIGPDGEMTKAIEELGTELAPMVKELSKSSSLLMAQLEQFTKGLESTQEGEQQAGKNFMDSLLSTLEKLNESIEEGAAEGKGADAETTK